MSTTPNASSNANSKNILNADVEIKGTLKFAGELTFDGKLEGDITSEGALNVGDTAVIKGKVAPQSQVVVNEERADGCAGRDCAARLDSDGAADTAIAAEGCTRGHSDGAGQDR